MSAVETCDKCGRRVAGAVALCQCAARELTQIRAQLAASEARVKELENIVALTGQPSTQVQTTTISNPAILDEDIWVNRVLWEEKHNQIAYLQGQLAAIRPAFEKLLEYAKAEEDSWEDFGNSDLDEYRQLRREALKLAEQLEVKG